MNSPEISEEEEYRLRKEADYERVSRGPDPRKTPITKHLNLLFSWIAGLTVFLFLITAIYKSILSLDIPIFIREQTSLGPQGACFVFSVMIAARCSMWIYHRNPHGGLNPQQRFEFKLWLSGVIIFGVITAILNIAFDYSYNDLWISDIINFAITVLVFIIMKRKYYKKV